ncbi:hypothetical protein TIFTF001_003746 [Ficus carica]|uniref:Uncharacterized protein n=1 Tax=Ficus carica TaxID=3494 RepID=A0AA87ZIC7_FICCA|nr:hypothetical protein TIFTF001_003746 [Ficus carica]
MKRIGGLGGGGSAGDGSGGGGEAFVVDLKRWRWRNFVVDLQEMAIKATNERSFWSVSWVLGIRGMVNWGI